LTFQSPAEPLGRRGACLRGARASEIEPDVHQPVRWQGDQHGAEPVVAEDLKAPRGQQRGPLIRRRDQAGTAPRPRSQRHLPRQGHHQTGVLSAVQPETARAQHQSVQLQCSAGLMGMAEGKVMPGGAGVRSLGLQQGGQALSQGRPTDTQRCVRPIEGQGRHLGWWWERGLAVAATAGHGRRA
jgi:hypothetical protein